MTLLLTLDEEEMSSQISSLDFGNRSVRDSTLAGLLVELGLPEIGVKLKGIDVFSREYLFDIWSGANSRWKLLTEGS